MYTINIRINIGLPTSRSSLQSILEYILPYKKVFKIGTYYGSKKPNNCNDFLKDFEKIIELKNNKKK